MMKKVSDFFNRLASTLISIIRMVLLSRPVPRPPFLGSPDKKVIILGNGPSLRDTIAEYGHVLPSATTVAVNFMANTPQFFELRPKYYVLADPHFFTGTSHDNVFSLWGNLSRAEWPLVLLVPVKRTKTARKLLGKNSKISVVPFNFVAAEGFFPFERWAYNRRLAMPRPRNVLIPAIMTAIDAGFDDIYLVGADHSWLETLRVDDRNHVVSIQPHFYADSKTELARSATEYKGYRLHDILYSFYIAFRSYHTIARYARSKGVRIYNSTPASFIDAFPRVPLF